MSGAPEGRRRTTSRWIGWFIEFVFQEIHRISSVFFQGNSATVLIFEQFQFNTDYLERLRDETND
jgi:hypothetical protein